MRRRRAPAYRAKAIEAAARVARGEAVGVRDGILQDEIEYSWPLLAGLMYVAARNAGRLSVLDFGGGPAVTYLQNRRFLTHIPSLDWRVVEMPDYCAACEGRFPLPGLSFHASLDAACAAGTPDVIILSGVLNMLEHPYDLLADISARAIPHILIDRLSMSLLGHERLTIYRADPAHHPALAFPCWWFDEAKLKSALEPDYTLIENFAAFFNPGPFASERAGYIFSRG